MGAHNFHITSRGESPEEAYEKAVDDAYYEYGHDPYNGTISTTFDFKMVPRLPGESFDEWGHRVLDHPGINKRESCACVAGEEENLWHFAGWAAS